MKTLLIATCVCLSLAGCGEPRPPQPQGKYMIWTGSAAFSIGYHTDSYTIADGMIKFDDKGNGVTKIVPMTSVLSIDER